MKKYEPQNFASGQPLYASQLIKMEQGIIDAQSNSGGSVEEGKGVASVQSLPREDKVSMKGAETVPHFDFDGNPESTKNGRVEFGATADYAISLGGRSSAQGKHSMAVNSQTVAAGAESFAAGYATITLGDGSFACGSKTVAKGTHAHAEGELTIAEATDSHAEGSETRSSGFASHAEGYDTISSGKYSHAEGSGSVSGGEAAHAEGNNTKAEAEASHAEGAGTQATGLIILTETDGDNATEGEGDDSNNDNIGGIINPDDYDNAEDLMQAWKTMMAATAHAEGNNTLAMAYGAHSEGVGTVAYGRASHVEGVSTSTGDFEEINGSEFGYDDNLNVRIALPEIGIAAHAEGFNTRAIGNYSHASGRDTVADADSQTVVGSFNRLNSRPGSKFVVGGGTSEYDRKNAFEVAEDGTLYILWEGNYYSLNNMLNLIANEFVKGNREENIAFFDAAKKSN